MLLSMHKYLQIYTHMYYASKARRNFVYSGQQAIDLAKRELSTALNSAVICKANSQKKNNTYESTVYFLFVF